MYSKLTEVHQYFIKSTIRGDIVIYKQLSDLLLIDTKKYAKKGIISKTIDINAKLLLKNNNQYYFDELGDNFKILETFVYSNDKIQLNSNTIGKISLKKFNEFVSFLENGLIHHHSSVFNDVKIQKIFIYQINNIFKVCNFKTINNDSITIDLEYLKKCRKIIFKNGEEVLSEILISKNHMTMQHHEYNMMYTKKFYTLNESIKYIMEK